jgi:hypothetical protein
MSDDKDKKPPAVVGTAKPDEPARMIPAIGRERLQLEISGHSMAIWSLVLHAGTEPDDILPVAFWAHCAVEFAAAQKQGQDRVLEVRALTEDKKWKATLTVVDAGDNWARAIFETTEDGKRIITKLGGFQSRKIVFLPGHTVNFAGLFAKWRVVRDADAQVLRDKFNTEGDAYAWLSEYAKSIAA